jgi:hypothetical protein
VGLRLRLRTQPCRDHSVPGARPPKASEAKTRMVSEVAWVSGVSLASAGGDSRLIAASAKPAMAGVRVCGLMVIMVSGPSLVADCD